MDLPGMDWQEAYEAGETPWDLRGVTPPLEHLLEGGFLARLELQPAARVAVPGCGRGHDLRLLAGQGLSVTGFDISKAAVLEARKLLELNGVQAEVLLRDVLALVPEFAGRFALAYDYTCFCAVVPHLRQAYGRSLAGCLAAGGWLLCLLFPTKVVPACGPGRPPFLVTEGDLQAALEPHFLLVDCFAAEGSAPGREGAERFYLYRKRPE